LLVAGELSQEARAGLDAAAFSAMVETRIMAFVEGEQKLVERPHTILGVT
jgi:hypothetical protein